MHDYGAESIRETFFLPLWRAHVPPTCAFRRPRSFLPRVFKYQWHDPLQRWDVQLPFIIRGGKRRYYLERRGRGDRKSCGRDEAGSKDLSQPSNFPVFSDRNERNFLPQRVIRKACDECGRWRRNNDRPSIKRWYKIRRWRTAWIKFGGYCRRRIDERGIRLKLRETRWVHVRKDDEAWNFPSDWKVSMKMLMSRGESYAKSSSFFFTATLARFDRENNRVCRAMQLRESRECLFVRQ